MNPIQIILGPGNHQNQLINELKKVHSKLIVYNYYPKFSRTVYSKGYIKKIEHSKLLNLLQWLIFGLGNKLKIQQKHTQQLFYTIYDWYISLSILPFDLIAWPQVSLRTIQKVKKCGKNIVLEYPMIHISEWQEIMISEYNRMGIIKDKKSIFPRTTENRILKEINLSDSITVLSSYAKDSFIKYGVNEDKINMRLLDIDNIFSHKKITRIEKQKDKTIFLFVGRLEILKGVHLLLEAFSKLSAQSIELWLVGDIYPEISKFTDKYSNNPQIIFLGKKTKEQLIDIYKKANILVLPSLQESFGLVILEALHFDCKVIASSNTGAPDIKKKYPDKITIFDSGNEEQLKKCLKKPITNLK